jgi:hypothetical protein
MAAGATAAPALDTAKTLSSKESRITSDPRASSHNRWSFQQGLTSLGPHPLRVAPAPAIAMDCRCLVPQEWRAKTSSAHRPRVSTCQRRAPGFVKSSAYT